MKKSNCRLHRTSQIEVQKIKTHSNQMIKSKIIVPNHVFASRQKKRKCISKNTFSVHFECEFRRQMTSTARQTDTTNKKNEIY